MIQSQINSFNMYISVLQYLDNNRPTWNTNSIITKAVEDFRLTVLNIQKTETIKQNKATNQAFNNERDKEILINLAYKLALRIKNYAVSSNNVSLKNAVDFSRLELQSGKESDVIERCRNIISKAKNITAPNEYKISTEFIEQVNAALVIITAATPENKINENSGAGKTAELETLFNSARSQLHTLDDLIEADADDDAAEFVRKCFSMRRIIDIKVSEN